MQKSHAMVPLTLHIGVGKTATTTFQEAFFPSHPQINYIGKSHRQGSKYADFKIAMRDLMLKDTTDYNPAILPAMLDEIASEKGIPLYSDECIIDTDKDKGAMIDRIAQTFPGCRVILTIREQRSFLTSLYGHDNNKLKGLPAPCNGRFIPIDQWLEYKEYELSRHTGFLFLIHYDKLIAYLHKILGQENVGVFLFEEFVANRTAYLKKLCHFIGVDYLPELDEEIGNAHFNPETADRWLQKQLYMNRQELAGSFLAKNKTLLRLAGALYSNVHKTPAPPEFAISPQWEEKLNSIFRKSNKICAERFNLPLGDYGYAL